MPKKFDAANYPWKSNINYRSNPERYLVGKGEQGVLICEPYKSEILHYWKFKNPDIAKKSANKIYKMFLLYIKEEDFVGADMARKFLQMGFTRSRRYANYKGGKKYKEDGDTFEKGSGDENKGISAELFYARWQQAEANKIYARWKQNWKETHG